MAIRGIGIDVVDSTRIARLLRGSGRFASRWFTPLEIDECEVSRRPALDYARRLALKEAAWKALGVLDWSGGVPWRHLQTSRVAGSVRIELAARLLSPSQAALQPVIHTAEISQGPICVAVVIIED